MDEKNKKGPHARIHFRIPINKKQYINFFWPKQTISLYSYLCMYVICFVHITQTLLTFLPLFSGFFHFLPLLDGRNLEEILSSTFFRPSWKKQVSSGRHPTLYHDLEFMIIRACKCRYWWKYIPGLLRKVRNV